ncbi:MAG: hypothetical protein RL235_794, partial [Chlamydiota bacterium]
IDDHKQLAYCTIRGLFMIVDLAGFDAAKLKLIFHKWY